ncbi:MAG: hypothetical protein A2Y74_01540 [Actinobacteria bacterium RBG_13_63_9]|nr:MAG: hypothetical protein A2Y74_01540 [Actinobacteria bacterium RBG_13_63_9]
MGANYRVVKIVEFSKIGATGDIERYNRITAVTTKGTSFTSDVPESKTTRDEVDRILAAKAKELDSIMG